LVIERKNVRVLFDGHNKTTRSRKHRVFTVLSTRFDILIVAPVYGFDFLYSFDLSELGEFRTDVIANHDQVQRLFEERLKKHDAIDDSKRVQTAKWSLFLDIIKQRWAHLLQESIQLDQRWTLHQTILLLRTFITHDSIEKAVPMVQHTNLALCYTAKMPTILNRMC
jgi:hypothetical protein